MNVNALKCIDWCVLTVFVMLIMLCGCFAAVFNDACVIIGRNNVNS